MTTIYKTTERGGRRAICSLPMTANDAVAVIKWLGNLGHCQRQTDKDGNVTIFFKGGERKATYSVVQENC